MMPAKMERIGATVREVDDGDALRHDVLDGPHGLAGNLSADPVKAFNKQPRPTRHGAVPDALKEHTERVYHPGESN